jgi:PAS domain S-box-containing protein
MSGEVRTDRIEELLPVIFDHVADGVTVLDRRGVLRFVNTAAAQLMGLGDPGEAIGRSSGTVMDRFEILDEDGGAFDMARLPTRLALSGDQDEPEAVVRFRQRGAAEDRWSLVRARLLHGATPDDDLVVTSFQDITSLTLSARRLTFLAEASAMLADSTDYVDGLRRVAELAVPTIADWCAVDILELETDVRRVAVTHPDPKMVSLAEEYQRRWPPSLDGPGPISSILDRGQPQLFPDLNDERLAELVRDPERVSVLRRLDIRAALVVPLVARGRTLGTMTFVMSESGRRFGEGDVTMAADLGRRAGAAIDSARLLWEREEAIRLRDEFIATASHDMRTPLAAVRGYAQLALRHLGTRRDDPDVVALERWLSDIDLSAGRLTRLVSEFMDASLIRGGHEVPLQIQRTDLVPLVAERVEEHRLATPDHHFELVAEVDSLSGLWDPARLARVMDNLLSNAAKFSPADTRVEVRVWREADGGRISVTDRGMGIAPGDRDLIFTPTYRGLNARRVQGTGLGLYGSRRLTEQMGGTVEVESELGKGSTFTIRLPLATRRGAGAR